MVSQRNAIAVLVTGILPALRSPLKAVNANLLLAKGAWIKRTHALECMDDEHENQVSTYARAKGRVSRYAAPPRFAHIGSRREKSRGGGGACSCSPWGDVSLVSGRVPASSTRVSLAQVGTTSETVFGLLCPSRAVKCLGLFLRKHRHDVGASRLLTNAQCPGEGTRERERESERLAYTNYLGQAALLTRGMSAI